jgi:photosystem II stability/assembly factor-like uncharacterized protein
MDPEDAVVKRATHALVIENVAGLEVRDLAVRWDEDQTEKNWQSALVLKNVSDFDVQFFSGRQGLKNGPPPAILLEDVSDSRISESRATEGCGTFIRVEGEKIRQISLRNNNTRKAVKDISFGSEQVRGSVETE